MSILRAPPRKAPRQLQRRAERQALKPPRLNDNIGPSRKQRRAVGLSLIAAACVMFSTHAEAFHDACDARAAVQTIAHGKDIAFLIEQREGPKVQTDKFIAMGAMALRFVGKGVASSGGSSTAITFRNPGMGTSFDSATGWITFGLQPGGQQVWVNGGRPDDSGDGLTPESAKKTFDALIPVALSFGASVQIMFAEGYTYTQTVNNWWTSIGGVSPTYPTAALSYDPADAANTAKYGRATGANMPIVVVPESSSGNVPFFAASAYLGTSNNYAIQGVGFSRALTASSNNSMGISGPRQNIVYQNCRFQNVSMGIQGQTLASNILYSKCSYFGAWQPSGGLALFVEKCDNLWFEDLVFYHSGWKIGASRDDTTTNGGTIDLEHDIYWHASNTGGHFNRCVHVDPANDPVNFRGGAAGKQLALWDPPIAMTLSGFSGSSSEAPDGVTITVEDVAVIGGADINTSLQRNWLFFGFENTLPGSYAKNIAAFDSPVAAHGSTFALLNSAGLQPHSYFTIENLRMYNHTNTDLMGYGGNSGYRIMEIKNSIVDTLTISAPQSGVTLTNVTVQAGATTYPNAVTRLQFAQNVCTAMGLSSSGTYADLKKRIVDVMIWRPDISWAPMVMAETLPKFGLTPLHETLSFPDMSAETPADIFVYHA